MKNRIGIFQMYSNGGRVEDYVVYLLNNIKENITDLYIVINGRLKEGEKDKLLAFTENIFMRENDKYFVSAFKDAITEYIGFEKIQKYEELLLFDDSFYGPIYPFREVFCEMDKTEADFWGLTKHGATDRGKEHLQSYFLVMREKLISNEIFIRFWSELDVEKYQKKSQIFNYNIMLTETMQEAGFCYESYVKDDEMNGNVKYNYDHSFFSPYTLMKKYRMPVLIRSALMEGKELKLSAGEELCKVFHYIDQNTPYDINLIWNDLLHNNNIADIKKSLGLNYILGTESDKVIPYEKKIAVVCHITYEDLLDACLEYVKQVPSQIDVYITSYKEEILNSVVKYAKRYKANIQPKKVIGRGRDVAAFFVGCRDIVDKYEYLCFVHDKKTSGNKGLPIIGASFFDLVWENMLKSEGYVKEIIHLLQSEPRLGLLSPPEPLHHNYSSALGNEWTVNYELTKTELDRMGVSVPISEKKHPFALSTCFWCKTKALQKMFTYPLDYSDFKEEPIAMDGELPHALERALSYVAQDAGYYSATVQNAEYASLYMENLRELAVTASRTRIELCEFADKYQMLYIYGAGGEAIKAKNLMGFYNKEILGYIVSDDRISTCKTSLAPIVRLEDVPQEAGIIVALNGDNTSEVKKILEAAGREEIFYTYNPIEK